MGEENRVVGQAEANTDTEIWRGESNRLGDPDRFYADSLFIPKSEVEALGINCGGHVIVKPIREWHALAAGVTVEPAALRELRELSEKATAGEWVRSKHCFQILTVDAMNSVTELSCPRGLATHPPDDRVERWQEDVKFIVACVNYVRAALAAGK